MSDELVIPVSELLSYANIAARYLLQEKQFSAVDQWLSDVDTVAGAVKHISTGLAGEALSILQAPLAGPRNKANNLMTYWESQFRITPHQAQVTNDIWAMFGQPNIEGIVIFTEKERTSRTADISAQPLVVNSEGGSTRYAIDNIVPKPRTWTLEGKLTVVLPTDHYLVVKPSIILQKQYLDNCARSRKPVWFKTWDNTFVKVLIESMDTSWDPKSLNTLDISLSLREYVPYRVESRPRVREILPKTYVGDAE